MKAAITQTGDVIWSMHKKKNSASVLAGEMILTFFKPKRKPKPLRGERNGSELDAAKILSEVFDACLANGLVVNMVGDGILRVLPPVVVTAEQIDEGAAVLEQAIRAA